MRVCPACGGNVRSGARFCSHCGVRLIVPPGTTLQNGRYRIIQVLGQGGMGAVHLAEDTRLLRKCVVKEMLPYYTTEAEKRKAEDDFRREALVLASLNQPGHPNIPEIYDHFVEVNRHFLAMKYVEGENLEDRLNRLGHPLSEEEVIKYVVQICDALAYVHGHQPQPAMHRDIKPSNILIDQNERACLVDFGLAKATPSTVTISGKGTVAAGTAGYTALEQWLLRPEPASDIYALGATMHHLLTGRDPRDPFARYRELNIPLLKHFASFPPLRTMVPSLSSEIEGIVSEMLDENPRRRPTALEFKQRLETLIAPPTARSFVFRSGRVASSIVELVRVSDQNWQDAVHHLYRGDFEDWLKSIGRYDLASKTGDITSQDGDQNAGLEEFLHLLDPTLALPVLSVSPASLDFGSLERGKSKALSLAVSNQGRGYLYGTVSSSVRWARPRPARIRCLADEVSIINVGIQTADIPTRREHSGDLGIVSNGGVATIPFTATMSLLKEAWRMVKPYVTGSFLGGFVGGLLGGGLAALLGGSSASGDEIGSFVLLGALLGMLPGAVTFVYGQKRPTADVREYAIVGGVFGILTTVIVITSADISPTQQMETMGYMGALFICFCGVLGAVVGWLGRLSKGNKP